MESLIDSIILLSDSYKITHWKQYPKGTRNVYSYFESRGGVFPYTIFFGLQYLLKRYLEGEVVTGWKINEAQLLFSSHFGNSKLFNEADWKYICDEHKGRLPVSIKAVPEGTKVPISNVLMTIEATDPRCYWLVNYLETLLVQTWYPTTVATQSYAIKQLIKKYLDETGDETPLYKLHDFGFRGVSSVESAGIGGAAHLINFRGTDTVFALKFLQDYYFVRGAAGNSIPASEHSTITSWRDEKDAMENMLDQYPDGLVACVSDSYDIFKACGDIWGTKLKDKIMGRNGTLVIRPDSGELPGVLLKIFEILFDKFGYTMNSKGYKVLPTQLRVIQGDGVNKDSIDEILGAMWQKGISADNIAFGMGGALLQKLDRDTQCFAFKCSSVNVDGVERDVFKTPITDSKKNSKRGRLKLIEVDGVLQTVKENEYPGARDHLVEVFRDGRIMKQYNFDEVRANAEKE